jgi:hypothetical protein
MTQVPKSACTSARNAREKFDSCEMYNDILLYHLSLPSTTLPTLLGPILPYPNLSHNTL